MSVNLDWSGFLCGWLICSCIECTRIENRGDAAKERSVVVFNSDCEKGSASGRNIVWKCSIGTERGILLMEHSCHSSKRMVGMKKFFLTIPFNREGLLECLLVTLFFFLRRVKSCATALSVC